MYYYIDSEPGYGFYSGKVSLETDVPSWLSNRTEEWSRRGEDMPYHSNSRRLAISKLKKKVPNIKRTKVVFGQDIPARFSRLTSAEWFKD